MISSVVVSSDLDALPASSSSTSSFASDVEWRCSIPLRWNVHLPVEAFVSPSSCPLVAFEYPRALNFALLKSVSRFG